MSISERAMAGSQPKKPPRVTCPCCDAKFDPTRAGKPRSIDQHRRFFAMVGAAYHHWPESHATQFADKTECRKWLTMKAGERDLVLRMPISGMKPEAAVIVATAAMKAAGAHAVAVAHKSELCVWAPRSIRFDRMSHLTFCALNDAVADVIKSEIGKDAEELMSKTEVA